jgi:hypothetical protein
LRPGVLVSLCSAVESGPVCRCCKAFFIPTILLDSIKGSHVIRMKSSPSIVTIVYDQRPHRVSASPLTLECVLVQYCLMVAILYCVEYNTTQSEYR